MIQKLRSRLARLARQSSRGPFAKSVREMTDEELLRRAGLPPDASDEEIAALVTEIEIDLGETALKEGTP
jgi:hypothetical protein